MAVNEAELRTGRLDSFVMARNPAEGTDARLASPANPAHGSGWKIWVRTSFGRADPWLISYLIVLFELCRSVANSARLT